MITLNIKKDGNLKATLVIDGVSSSYTSMGKATFNIAKEYSTDLVKCYQGTYTGSKDNGVFNIIILDQDLYGLSRLNIFEESETLF